MRYPTYIKNCIELLERSGYHAYAVGGAVRDALLSKEPSDWDVTTSARPDEILSVFSGFRTIPTGIKHGTVTVLVPNDDKCDERVPVEITTFRIDGKYGDARHPESVRFSPNVEDDLSRRDFTVNAMAFNEKEGLIDLFGGRNDLEDRIIRAVGDPEKRFSEDALRILRAFRFSSQLEFEIEENTLLGAKKCATLLKKISRERVGSEFKKLILSSGVVYSLEKMAELGIWGEIFDIPYPEKDMICRLRELNNGHFETRLAVLVADLDNEQRDEFLNSLRLSNADKKLIIRLCSVKDFEICESEKERKARSFLHYFGDILPLSLEILRFYNADSEDFARLVELEASQKRPLSISELDIRGSDILPLCAGDYSRVGKTLAILLECVLDDPSLNRKEKLIEIAKKELE